ncbi:MAG: hypothetical protein E7650_07755 [Ruminococcaceae bacterium]|nr:hypothetical protein [Oscillospiraceae bacterium]
MRNLLILVKMQLKEQLNFTRFEIQNVNLFKVLVSIVAAILKFALVTALCGAFLIVAKFLNLFSLTSSVPPSVISLVFTIMLAASVVSCTIGLTKALYFSRDNAILLTLPCLPIQVYLSKLIIFFIFEIKRNFSFVVPLFLAYFITHAFPFKFYPWLLVCILLTSLFTVGIGSILSIPAMWISSIFRQRKWLQISCLVAVVGLSTWALFFAISLIPENINLVATWGTTYWDIQDFLNAYVAKMSLAFGITQMIIGELHSMVPLLLFGPTLFRFSILFGVTAVCFALGLVLVRPTFYKMASKPFEHAKHFVRPKKNRVLPRPISAIWIEILGAVKGAARLFANVGILIALPMLIFLLNKIFLAMNTRAMGNYMVVAFNALIMLLILLNSNCYIASIYSRDGRSSYLIKVQPARYWPLLLAKLFPNVSFMLLTVIATFVVLMLTASLGTLQTVLLTVAILAVYLAHLLFCAEQDLMNPQTELYATVGASEDNINETRATLTAFLFSFAIAALLFVLMLESSGAISVYVKFLAVALAVLLYRLNMFFSKIKLYYKEK